MKKGFATSAILYTMLLLFIVLLVGILNNLQNKKTILDGLKEDTVKSLSQDVMIDSLLEQLAIINDKIIKLENQNNNLKQELDQFQEQIHTQTLLFRPIENTYVTINNVEIKKIGKLIYVYLLIDVKTTYAGWVEIGTIENVYFDITNDLSKSVPSYVNDTNKILVRFLRGGNRVFAMPYGKGTYATSVVIPIQ